MSKIVKKQVQKSLFRGQKYQFQGYPEWYNNQLAKNRPIQIHLFNNQLQNAAFFYQKQAKKFHFANNVLNIQLDAVNRQIQELQMMITQVEQNENSSAQDKKRRFRRCANQIQRKFVCPIANCQKSYGTEGSMAQHMRLKHPGFTYVMADLNSEPGVKEENQKIGKLEEQVKKQNKK